MYEEGYEGMQEGVYEQAEGEMEEVYDHEQSYN